MAYLKFYGLWFLSTAVTYWVMVKIFNYLARRLK